jgi:hypothetical protein
MLPFPSPSSNHYMTLSFLHHLTLVSVTILIAVIFLHVQKSKTTYQSHYFFAMSLNRHQRRCLQCKFWGTSLSHHYQYSPRCDLTRSSSPCFSSNDDRDDTMTAGILNDLSFQRQIGHISALLHPKVMSLPLLMVCLRTRSMRGFFLAAILHSPLPIL